MANQYNAGQLATIIKQLAQNDIQDLGNDDAQNSFIFQYLNIIMWELAKIAELTTYSDALAISGNGYVTFLKGGVSIDNTMFEPKVLYNASNVAQTKRTSFEQNNGWIREAQDLQIHVQGLTAGSYTLKYLRYPKQVTVASDVIEFASSANATICKQVVALIKLSKNSYAGFQTMDAAAKAGMGLAAQGAISAKSTGSTGTPLGPMDIAAARGQ